MSNASRGAAFGVRSLVLGLDVSPRRLGWGLVDLETGEAVACGMEPIDLPDHGWWHQQITRALRRVADVALWDSDDPRGEVSAVYIECPISRFPGMAYNEGRAVGALHGEVERRWPWVHMGEDVYLKPSEWKKLAGLKGNASKADVWAEALRIGGRVIAQDAADALLIARAGWARNADTWTRGAADGEAA